MICASFRPRHIFWPKRKGGSNIGYATAAANVGAHSSNRHYQLWITLVGAPVSLDISSNSMSKSGRSISVRAGRLEFVKLNAAKFNFRDSYHFILTLTLATVRCVGSGRLHLDQSCLRQLVFAWWQVHRRATARFVLRSLFLQRRNSGHGRLRAHVPGHLLRPLRHDCRDRGWHVRYGRYHRSDLCSVLATDRPDSIQQMCRHFAFRRSTNLDAAGGQPAPHRDG